MKNAPKILSAAVAVTLVAFRLFVWGGDEPEAPVTPPAVAATDTAAAGNASATQPVSTAGTAQPQTQPAAAPTAAADEEDDAPKQSADFPARFEKRVDRMCARAERRSKALERKGIKDMDDVHAMVVVYEDLATDLETSKAPTRNRRAWRGYTRLVRDASNAVGRIEIEAADGDFSSFWALEPKLKSFENRITKASSRYGFAECADD